MGSMEELLRIANGGNKCPGGNNSMTDLSALLNSEELKGMDPKELSKQAGQVGIAQTA